MRPFFSQLPLRFRKRKIVLTPFSSRQAAAGPGLDAAFTDHCRVLEKQ